MSHLSTPGPITNSSNPTGFVPLNRDSGSGSQSSSTGNGSITNSTTTGNQQIGTIKTNPIPVLRLLSNTPVGGYAASTTGTTTVMRWVDRGRGNVYQTRGDTLNITTLSNTLLPRLYNSSWNKDLTAFIGQTLQDDSETPTSIYAQLQSRAITSTTSASTSFDLRGKNLPDNTIGYAVSPKKDQVFLLVKGDTVSTGYVTNFDGTKAVQIFTTPLAQLNVDWPSDNIISITNKGTADRAGYLYFVNPKTGAWTKILGPLNGLSSRVSQDGKKVFFSVAGSNADVKSAIYNIASSTITDVVIQTLADKCVWGNFYKEIVYCAVPFQPVSGTYPDDWYLGSLSTIDKIWQINSITGETKLVNNLIGQADRVIDAFSLVLDNKDNFLLFMNKNDLSLWSLDLVRSK